MKRKQLFVMTGIALLLALLVYLQFRTWKSFDWDVFLEQTSHTRPLYLLGGIAMTYLTYVLRAVRWKIFLRPVRKAHARELVAPMFIGFTGLALLGRPGELIRPYLLARRVQLSFASQIAVWTVERLFDMGAYTILLVLVIFTSSTVEHLPYYEKIREIGYIVVSLVGGLILFVFLIWRFTESAAAVIEHTFHRFPQFGRRMANRIRAFGEGLHTIHGPGAFFQLLGVSLAIWIVVSFAYRFVLKAYPAPIQDLTLAHAFLLMAFSMIGSMVQLPAIGGGSQLAVIAAMVHILGLPREMAVSCGIMLWLVTFMSVTPVGLAVAHHEHVSIVELTQETQAAPPDPDAPAS